MAKGKKDIPRIEFNNDGPELCDVCRMPEDSHSSGCVYSKKDKKDVLKAIYEGLHKTYCDKNSDYGDSFTKVRQKYNDRFPVILIRLADKFNRLEALLLNGNQKIKDESIKDTLLDIANYCAMEVMDMELENSKRAKILNKEV